MTAHPKSDEKTGSKAISSGQPDRGRLCQKSAQSIAADTARYEAVAREHGADLSEEGFNEALRKMGKQVR